MKKAPFLLIAVVFISISVRAQTVQITKVTPGTVCEGSTVSYFATVTGYDHPECLNFIWSFESSNDGSFVTSPNYQSVDVLWNNGGTLRVTVSTSHLIADPNSIDLCETFPGFSDTDDFLQAVEPEVTGSLSASTDFVGTYCAGSPSADLTAAVSGDAVFDGWYLDGTKISGLLEIPVPSAGIFVAKATLTSACNSQTLQKSVVIPAPATFTTGTLIGARTAYRGRTINGTLSYLGQVSHMDRWEVSTDGVTFSTYSTAQASKQNYSLSGHDGDYTFRVRIRKSCPEETWQYSNEVVISQVDYIPDYNTIENISYSNNDQIVGQAKSYFGFNGELLQSQSKDFEVDDIFVNEPLYDDYDRQVGQTLSAPIDQAEFEFKPGFATVSDNPLSESDWASDFPPILDQAQPYTLGHYYSGSTEAPMTKYPYTVSNFYEDGSGEQKTGSQPGDRFYLKSGNNGIAKVLPVHDPSELPYYEEIRNLLGQLSFPERLVKQVSIDPNGNVFVAYIDDNENQLAAAIGVGGSNMVTVQVPQQDIDGESTIEFHQSSSESNDLTYYDLINEEEVTSPIKPPGFYRFTNNSDNVVELDYHLTYGEHSYSFYDTRGRMIASMTPRGVERIKSRGGVEGLTVNQLVSEYYATLYTYDFQGRLIKMREPDAGITEYVYRTDGQVRFSQSSEQVKRGQTELQATGSIFSYTNYDDLGRPVESGEAASYAERYFSYFKENLGSNLFTSSQWIKTYYDTPMLEPLPAEFSGEFSLEQRFVQGAVSSTESESVQSWYSYDDRGRVEWFLQYVKELDKYFLLQYTYDFLGNVTLVAFQPQAFCSPCIGDQASEAFWHRYTYDANQRLKTVKTSIDNSDWYHHATYEYFDYGPLKRVVLADDLQGMDYQYTSLGWLKSINHPVRGLDPGADGNGGSAKEDAFGMTLEYFDYDFNYHLNVRLDENEFPPQYNGNIRATVFQSAETGEYVTINSPGTVELDNFDDERVVARQSIRLKPGFDTGGSSFNATIGNEPTKTLNTSENVEVYAYHYDEKSQLTQAKFGAGIDGSTNEIINDDASLDVQIEGYDENGNIDGLVRYDEYGTVTNNFNYVYAYELDPTSDDYCQCNRLHAVSGYIAKLSYNEIGQVTAIDYIDESQSDIKIYHDVNGKVTAVFDAGTDEPLMSITYDDRGFRLMKEVGNAQTWYIRDASGQVIAMYNREKPVANELPPISQIELPIYGSGKLGMAFKNPDHYKYMYELTDHLGNVRALVTKLGLMATASMETDEEDPGIDEYEQQFFDNIYRSPNAYRSGARSALTNAARPLGPTTTLRVQGGDQINLDVWAHYDDNLVPTNAPVGSALEQAITDAANGSVIGVENSTLTGSFNSFLGGLLAMATGNSGEPLAYLQFILLDESFEQVDLGGMNQFVPVTGVQDSEHNFFEKLAVSFEVPESVENGYLYAFVVNQSDVNVFWDDFTFEILGNRVLRKSDFYPFGAVAKMWENPENDYPKTVQRKVGENLTNVYTQDFSSNANGFTSDSEVTLVLTNDRLEAFTTESSGFIGFFDFARFNQNGLQVGEFYDISYETDQLVGSSRIMHFDIPYGGAILSSHVENGRTTVRFKATAALVGFKWYAKGKKNSDSESRHYFDNITIDHVEEFFEDEEIMVSTVEPYRHDYQGQYAEKDEETGWNAFQLRMYDPLIGRWLQVDPMRQYANPYNGMGNDPINGVDPTGGWRNRRRAERQHARAVHRYGSENVGDIATRDINGNDDYGFWINWESHGEYVNSNRSWNYATNDAFSTPWMQQAASQIGVSEIAGPTHNQTILDYLHTTGAWWSTDETAWCSAFCNWSMIESEVFGGQLAGTNNAEAESWMTWGRSLSKPKYGAIAVINNGTHVGFVAGVNSNGGIVLLGGNQSDQVKYSVFSKNSITHYRYHNDYKPRVTMPSFNIGNGGDSVN